MATANRTAAGRIRWTGERLVYSGYAAFVLLMVLLGFGPSLAGRMAASGPPLAMTPLIWLHGAAFAAWILLFVTQVSLIPPRLHAVHRKLGLAAVVLVPVMLLLGLAVAAVQLTRGAVPPGYTPEQWLAVPLFDLFAFAGLASAGVLMRKQPQVHKRLMLFAMLVFLYPSIGRFPFLLPLMGGEASTLISFLLATPLLAWDLKSRGRVQPATLIGLGVMGGEQVVRLLVWKSAAWAAVAHAIVGVLG